MERFPNRLNQAPDLKSDFLASDAYVFTATGLESFDPKTGGGTLTWVRHRRKPRIAFDHMTEPFEAVAAWEFPPSYPEPKPLAFEVAFVDPRTVRLRWRSRPGPLPADASLMLTGPVPQSDAWKLQQGKGTHTWKSTAGSLTVRINPWAVEIRDASGRLLLKTHTLRDGRCMIGGRPIPFSFARRAGDGAHRIAASFSLLAGEKIFGCGESFTDPNKRGQSVDIWTQDAHGSQTGEMYKPVPFYLSSRGYGVFVHGSTPMTFDFGHDYADTQVLYSGDESIDLFVFLGGPQEVLTSYTALTGRSPRPPLWSFGLWMSRITYNSEAQVRDIATKLREHRVPCDVIHLDTGWFERDWGCDYEFSPTRFPTPEKMIVDLREQGFRISVWQLPYFTPINGLFDEIVNGDLAVRGPSGDLPTDDAVLDFSNPRAVAWYQEKLRGLLDLGVGAIKVDFGEAAPYNGLYHSGSSGHHEHNLYPLRYNLAATEITRKVTGASLIWARSAWAGSQRCPVHWGGDAEASDGGMLGSLWGGLSFGLSGFSFWSHDIGGFSPATARDLYLRWAPFGLLCSHSRCHGVPPTEPWEFDPEFLRVFRQATELRYRLLPYIWAEAAECSAAGHPLLRPLFFEFPQDPGSWLVNDAYLLGPSLLVAPLFEEVRNRDVYIPPGTWVDLQTEKSYQGPAWVRIGAGDIPAILLLRAGRVVPTAEPRQHTGEIDFGRIELWVAGDGDSASGLFCAPDESSATAIEVTMKDGSLAVTRDPGGGRVRWTVRRLGAG